MSTPPVPDHVVKEALAAYKAAGDSYLYGRPILNEGRSEDKKVAYGTFRDHVKMAKARGFDQPSGVQDSVTKARLDYSVSRGGHRRVYDEETGRQIDTVRYEIPRENPAQDNPEDLLDRIKTAFDGIESAPPVDPPENVMADLCSVYPLMDVHLGMHAWGRETSGDDYDLKLALGDMRHAFAKVVAITPASDTGVLIIGGDFFHADNNNAETPANRHKLDVDGRFDKVVDGGIAILVETIDRLLTRHASVIVRALRGNHDENAFRILRVGLAAWYRSEPRITVDAGPRDLFMMQWGTCAIFAHHGDKAKPQQAALYVSDICPFWSETRHRHFLTGHVHHDQAKDVGPLRWESLRAFCPPDAYAASMGYGARRALQSLTFHKKDGLVLRAMDPIQRQS